MIIPLDEMKQWALSVFTTVGLSAEAATATVENLAFAETRGVKTHGFMRLPIYVERILGGGISARASLQVEADRGALLILDAGNGIGAASGFEATGMAIDRARQHGIGCAIVRNANHFGAAAFYSSLMADAGMFGIAVCNTDKAMAPPFGGTRVLGTNPLAIAVPLPAGERPQLDMATSEVSLGKVLVAAQEHRDIPLGWAVDEQGEPTRSATAALGGALLPSGGPKGFGLAFMIDALVALSGATTSPQAGAMYGDRSTPQKLGFAFIAIDGAAGVAADEYTEAIRSLVDDVHRGGPGASGAPSLAPGEPELARSREFSGQLDVGGELLEDLTRIGELTGVVLR
jgi:LDH2 family malate/lactate/ureidoglycolate dehydrogenase